MELLQYLGVVLVDEIHQPHADVLNSLHHISPASNELVHIVQVNGHHFDDGQSYQGHICVFQLPYLLLEHLGFDLGGLLCRLLVLDLLSRDECELVVLHHLAVLLRESELRFRPMMQIGLCSQLNIYW